MFNARWEVIACEEGVEFQVSDRQGTLMERRDSRSRRQRV